MSSSRFVVLLLFVVACGGSARGGEDASVDADAPDGEMMEGGADADAPDGDAPDADAPDGEADGGDETDASVPACEVGSVRCAGLVPEACDEAGTWQAGEACDFVCDAGTCTGECVPGTLACDGNQPEVCSAAGAFEPMGDACAFVCTTGVCTGACAPGTKRCGAGGTGTVETCDAAGTFAVTKTCSQACSAGACVCAEDYEGDGDTCTPLDFCAPGRGGCSPHATCTQTGVTPHCACNPGFAGDGLACATSPQQSTLTQRFDDITTLSAAGWIMQNSSVPVGAKSFMQGLPTMFTRFDAFDGGPNAYMAVNFESTGDTGTISDWLLTPELDFGEYGLLEFYTRTISDLYPDRLEVRVCTTLPCAAPGPYPATTGFETLMLSVNPDQVRGVYPTSWTRYSIATTHDVGLPRSGRGRIAFRYVVTDAGKSGMNSEGIGIDAVRYIDVTPLRQIIVKVSFVNGPRNITVSLNRVVSLPISSAGTFTIASRVDDDTPYVVTVRSAPAGTTCTVPNGTGTVGSGSAVFVDVACVTE